MTQGTDSWPVFDVAVVGAGVMGATTALHLARSGLQVALIDRGGLCQEASGVNAGTLTLHMTRAALIPYAMEGRALWLSARDWLGMDAGAVAAPGLSVAFTPDECGMLEQRAASRREAGAPITLLTGAQAVAIEPGLNGHVRAAAYCELDGHVTAYLTGRAYRHALAAESVSLMEGEAVLGVARHGGHWALQLPGGAVRATRIVLAGGAWLSGMLAWFGLDIAVHCLVNQLVVTERVAPVMRSVIGIANGLLSLKQFANGCVLIGGGWQGEGDLARGGDQPVPENVIGNVRLARHAIPALGAARINRIWFGLESGTDDSLPLLGAVPGAEDAFVIGCVHSGYTSGPAMGKLMADIVLAAAEAPAIFDPARLLRTRPGAAMARQETGTPA